MRIDKVSLFHDLHVVQDAKCFSSSSSHKCQPKGRMNSEERGQDLGLIQTWVSLRQILNLSDFDMF